MAEEYLKKLLRLFNVSEKTIFTLVQMKNTNLKSWQEESLIKKLEWIEDLLLLSESEMKVASISKSDSSSSSSSSSSLSLLDQDEWRNNIVFMWLKFCSINNPLDSVEENSKRSSGTRRWRKKKSIRNDKNVSILNCSLQYDSNSNSMVPSKRVIVYEIDKILFSFNNGQKMLKSFNDPTDIISLYNLFRQASEIENLIEYCTVNNEQDRDQLQSYAVKLMCSMLPRKLLDDFVTRFYNGELCRSVSSLSKFLSELISKIIQQQHSKHKQNRFYPFHTSI